MKDLLLLACLLVSVVQLHAQSALYNSGYQVPETISVGTTQVVNVPASATLAEVRTLVNDAVSQSSLTMTTHIKFAAGAEYRFGESDTNESIFSIRNPKNVIFDGQGCKFVVMSRTRFMSVNAQNTFMVRDFELDYDPRFATHVKISEWNSSNNTCVMTVQEGYPLLDSPYFKETPALWWTPIEKDAEGKWRLVEGFAEQTKANTVTPLGDRRYRVKVAGYGHHGTIAGQVPGTPYMLRMRDGLEGAVWSRINGDQCFYIYGGKNFILRNVTVHNAPSSVVDENANEGSVYYQLRVNPGLKHVWGSCADGIFVVNQRNGPWIEQCELNHIGDDVIVVKNSRNYLTGYDASSATPYRLSGGGGWYRVGDSITLMNMKTRKLIGHHKVVKTSSNSQQAEVNVALEPAVNVGEALNNKDVWVYNNSTACNNFVLKDNLFSDHRRWGVLCSGRDGTIVGNRFVRGQCAAIYLINSPKGIEGSTGCVPANIEIRDNVFEETWHSMSGPLFAVVGSRMVGGHADTYAEEGLKDFKSDYWKGIENISIVNNRFKNWYFKTSVVTESNSTNLQLWNVPAIYMRDANKVVIRGNEFEMNHVKSPMGSSFNTWFAEDANENNGDNIITIIDCENVSNYGNTHANDAPASVESPMVDGLDIRVQCGEMRIVVDEKQDMMLYAADGRMVRCLEVNTGVNIVRGLQKGVYVLNGRKVVI